MNISLNKDQFLGACLIVAALVISGAWVYTARLETDPEKADVKIAAALEKVVLPEKGVVLPVKWGDLGQRLVQTGVIDLPKLEALYNERGGLDKAGKNLLTASDNGRLVITKENSNLLLNLLWALGLVNKNVILEKGPMVDKQYGGDAGRFASTGGWTLAVGNSMDHYSRHALIVLTSEQQSLVENVSKNIYRPCCGNSTHFPDCNHGMAMLGFLELMASQVANEEEMYKAALTLNTYWFPDNYLTIARYLKKKGFTWNKVSAKGILGREYSSASGYQQIEKQVAPAAGGGGSCGV